MTMRLAMIGLGKMGANMARRLCRKGIEVVGYDRDVATVAGLAAETSMVAAASVADAVSKLTAPRVVWLMLPSGVARASSSRPSGGRRPHEPNWNPGSSVPSSP